MSDPTPLGPILDELGVHIHLSDSERVTEVLVLAKTVDLDDGDVSLYVVSNELDWIAQCGLHSAAGRVLADVARVDVEDDE